MSEQRASALEAETADLPAPMVERVTLLDIMMAVAAFAFGAAMQTRVGGPTVHGAIGSLVIGAALVPPLVFLGRRLRSVHRPPRRFGERLAFLPSAGLAIGVIGAFLCYGVWGGFLFLVFPLVYGYGIAQMAIGLLALFRLGAWALRGEVRRRTSPLELYGDFLNLGVVVAFGLSFAV
jgi:hypothetical protein